MDMGVVMTLRMIGMIVLMVGAIIWSPPGSAVGNPEVGVPEPTGTVGRHVQGLIHPG
jgi:hypothetical protein